jgi:hypothetical protein
MEPRIPTNISSDEHPQLPGIPIYHPIQDMLYIVIYIYRRRYIDGIPNRPEETSPRWSAKLV